MSIWGSVEVRRCWRRGTIIRITEAKLFSIKNNKIRIIDPKLVARQGNDALPLSKYFGMAFPQDDRIS